jgi:hypothetical protein
MSNKKQTITIMCDYSADGLWLDGSAIDYDYLVTEGILLKSDTELRNRIYDWQMTYESFDFYSGQISNKSIQSSQKYKDWVITGREIAVELRKVIPNKYNVEYFDEDTGRRFNVIL